MVHGPGTGSMILGNIPIADGAVVGASAVVTVPVAEVSPRVQRVSTGARHGPQPSLRVGLCWSEGRAVLV